MITVGIPVYNAAEYIGEAIESVLSQSYEDWELIITDDGSTDGSVQIVKEYLKDPRIKLIVDGEHRGISYRLNQQVSMARGEFFARMDADDVMLPERLRLQLHYMNENKAADVCGTAAGKWTFIHPTVMGKTGWFRIYPYRSECDGCEDWDLWLRAKKNSVFGFLTDPLLVYRTPEHRDKKKYLERRRQGRNAIRLNKEILGPWRYYTLLADSYLKSWLVTLL